MTPPPDALEVALDRLQAGDYAGAEAGFRAALHHDPEDVEALTLLALACGGQGRDEEAVVYFERAARKQPDPERLCNLGAGLSKLGRLDAAAAAFRRALDIDPGYADAHRNFGVCRLRAGDEAEAEHRFREALRLRPDYPDALYNLLALLRRQERHPEAIEVADRLVRLRPADPAARAEMGIVLQRAGRLTDAVACHAEAVRLRPDFAVAHLNRAMALLALGDLAQGWAEYEWRWPALNLPRPDVRAPAWDGTDPVGRRLLLWAEQGLGDSLQFIRYAGELQARGAEVVFRCPSPLVRLLARTPGISRLISEDDPVPPCDAHAPLISLPGLLGARTPENIPAPVPYVHPDPALVAAWADRLRAIPGFRVGVCWQGSPTNPEDRRRSFGPGPLAPLAAVPGVALVSLQKGEGAGRLTEIAGRFPVHTLDGLDEASGPFMDTAAVMRHLHLVVTCDSAIAHLAGAAGIPVWVALPYAADWRWLTGRPDSPWYPTARLFRQRAPGDWADVFHRMAADLRAHRRGVALEVSPGELLDRLTILELKRDRLADSPDYPHVLAELDRLAGPAALAAAPPEVRPLVAELRRVNADLWAAEDRVRQCEQLQDFGPAFVAAARTIYLRNDRRAGLKRRINEVLGSTLLEVKSHARYDGPTPRPDCSHTEPT